MDMFLIGVLWDLLYNATIFNLTDTQVGINILPDPFREYHVT